MFDPPGSSLFYLRLAIGCIGAAVICWLAQGFWLCAPLAISGAFAFWKAIRARGTDYR